MEERGMEEEGKDREGEGWGIVRKNISFLELLFLCLYCNQEF
jgi:hypothetical protein